LAVVERIVTVQNFLENIFVAPEEPRTEALVVDWIGARAPGVHLVLDVKNANSDDEQSSQKTGPLNHWL